MKTRILALAAIVAILIALSVCTGSKKPRTSDASQAYALEVKTKTAFGK